MRQPRLPIKDRLVAVLQSSLPEIRGFKLLWRSESIYPARGAWLHVKMDVQRWQAAAYDANWPNENRVVLFVGCWETMGNCVRAGEVELCNDGETVSPKWK